MSRPLRIEDRALSHVGLVRSENEDSHLSLPQAQVWVVADGMGGHANGRFASQAIVTALGEAQIPGNLPEAVDAIAAAFQAANAHIYAAGQDAAGTMGSTAVALVIRGREFAVLWAGDSRAYLFRDEQLIALTRDHSQVQELLDRGVLAPEDAANHPMRHVLARAVGVQAELEIDGIRDEVAMGDLFLLCSDGLHGVLSDDEIAEIVRRNGPHSDHALVDACLERGAPDNVTISLVGVSEPTLLAVGGEDFA